MSKLVIMFFPLSKLVIMFFPPPPLHLLSTSSCRSADSSQTACCERERGRNKNQGYVEDCLKELTIKSRSDRENSQSLGRLDDLFGEHIILSDAQPARLVRSSVCTQIYVREYNSSPVVMRATWGVPF